MVSLTSSILDGLTIVGKVHNTESGSLLFVDILIASSPEIVISPTVNTLAFKIFNESCFDAVTSTTVLFW